MHRPRVAAGLIAAVVLAGCSAAAPAGPSAGSTVPVSSIGPNLSIAPVGSAGPGAASGEPGPSAGAAHSPVVGSSPAASQDADGPTPVPSGAFPRLVLSVTGTYRKTGTGPYAGTTDDYAFSGRNLVIQPLSGGKVALRGRLTLTEDERLGTSLDCHGTFTATYQIATTGTIAGDPAAPVYEIQLALAHPPVDAIKLHCTTGISTSKSPHGALVGAWSSLLGPIDVPYLGGSFKLSGSGADPYFGLTADGAFSARPG